MPLCLHVDQLSLSHSDLSSREQETFTPVHVINVDIQDNHEEATLGAFLICELCQCVSVCLPDPTQLQSHSYFVIGNVSFCYRNMV